MNLVARHNAELTALCRRFGVRRLELFGSVATRQDDPTESDVDFLVEFETLPDGTYADAYFGLLESLEALLQRPVDLVVATAITNPYFRKSVDQTKALVYAAWVFRNILIHGYAEVDHRIVWEVATVKVPALAADVRALLEAAEGPDAI